MNRRREKDKKTFGLQCEMTMTTTTVEKKAEGMIMVLEICHFE